MPLALPNWLQQQNVDEEEDPFAIQEPAPTYIAAGEAPTGDSLFAESDIDWQQAIDQANDEAYGSWLENENQVQTPDPSLAGTVSAGSSVGAEAMEEPDWNSILAEMENEGVEDEIYPPMSDGGVQ